MVCRKCGELLDEKAKVCPACGANQRAESGTKLNPIHTDDDDCAHEEARKPRKRQTKGFRFPMILLPILFFLGNTLLLSLGEAGQKLITIYLVVFVIFSIVVSTLNRRK